MSNCEKIWLSFGFPKVPYILAKPNVFFLSKLDGVASLVTDPRRANCDILVLFTKTGEGEYDALYGMPSQSQPASQVGSADS